MKITFLKIIIPVLLLANILFFTGRYFGVIGYRVPSQTIKGIPGLILLNDEKAQGYSSVSSDRVSSCYSFGPYASKKVADLVAERISAFGLAVAIRRQRTLNILNYMVYLRALPSRQEAEAVVADIKKHEIREFSIVETGPFKNAIALGSFDELDKARRHSEYIRYLGYDAQYTEQKGQKIVYWLDYDEPFGSNAPVEQWSFEVAPKISVQKIPKKCAL